MASLGHNELIREICASMGLFVYIHYLSLLTFQFRGFARVNVLFVQSVTRWISRELVNWFLCITFIVNCVIFPLTGMVHGIAGHYFRTASQWPYIFWNVCYCWCSGRLCSRYVDDFVPHVNWKLVGSSLCLCLPLHILLVNYIPKTLSIKIQSRCNPNIWIWRNMSMMVFTF